MDNIPDTNYSTQESNDDPSAGVTQPGVKTLQRMEQTKGRMKKRRSTPAAVTTTYSQLQQSRIQLQNVPVEENVNGNETVDAEKSQESEPVSSVPLSVSQPESSTAQTESEISEPKNNTEELNLDPSSTYESEDDLNNEDDGTEPTSNTAVKSGYAAIHRSSVGKQNDLPDDMEELKKLVRQYQAQIRQATGSSPEAFISNVEATARLRIQLQQKLDNERQKYDTLLDENRRLALRIKELDKGNLTGTDSFSSF